jgi:hypothetical protein
LNTLGSEEARVIGEKSRLHLLSSGFRRHKREEADLFLKIYFRPSTR